MDKNQMTPLNPFLRVSKALVDNGNCRLPIWDSYWLPRKPS